MYRGILLDFLNMGSGEIMLILVAVLLLFGGKKLPELARGLGKGIRDFKDASDGVKREIHRNINSVDIVDDLKSAINDEPDRTVSERDYEKSQDDLHDQMYPSTLEEERNSRDDVSAAANPSDDTEESKDSQKETTKI